MFSGPTCGRHFARKKWSNSCDLYCHYVFGWPFNFWLHRRYAKSQSYSTSASFIRFHWNMYHVIDCGSIFWRIQFWIHDFVFLNHGTFWWMFHYNAGSNRFWYLRTFWSIPGYWIFTWTLFHSLDPWTSHCRSVRDRVCCEKKFTSVIKTGLYLIVFHYYF